MAASPGKRKKTITREIKRRIFLGKTRKNFSRNANPIGGKERKSSSFSVSTSSWQFFAVLSLVFQSGSCCRSLVFHGFCSGRLVGCCCSLLVASYRCASSPSSLPRSVFSSDLDRHERSRRPFASDPGRSHGDLSIEYGFARCVDRSGSRRGLSMLVDETSSPSVRFAASVSIDFLADRRVLRSFPRWIFPRIGGVDR